MTNIDSLGGASHQSCRDKLLLRFGLPIMLALLVASCGGGGGDAPSAVESDPGVEDPAQNPPGSSPPPEQPEGGDGEPQEPAPGLAPLPVVGDDGNVQWAFGPETGGLNIEVQRFARLPLGSNGRPSRLNAMAYTGNRLFVSDESDALIYDITSGAPALYMDVGAIVRATGRRIDTESTWHAGLRSFAFHPEFATNGKLYVSLMESRPADPNTVEYLSDVTNPIGADSVLIEFTVDPLLPAVTIATYRQVLRVGMPVYDHTIKQIGFNPGATPGSADYGLLYIAHGDGSEASATAGGGQGKDALGKILRIDPLEAANGDPYSVPASNPFVGNDRWLPESYSVGHRNPHHIAFIGESELLVAEPGRDNIEELNLVKGGQNFGWPDREGTYVHLQRSGLLVGIEQLPANDADGYEYPVVQLGHIGPSGATFVRQAIGGGYVAPANSSLAGQYLYCEFAGTGEIFYSSVNALRAAKTNGAPDQLTRATINKAGVLFDHDDDSATELFEYSSMLDVVRSSPDFSDAEGIRADIRYGRGPQGELYLMSKRNRMVYLITNSRPGG